MLAQGWKKRLAGALFGLSVGTISQPASATMSIRTLAAQETRLASIGYRISTANAATCAAPTMMSGLVIHDLSQYPVGARAVVSRAFSLGDGVGIVGIVPGSGAERAGLRIDDEVISIGGRSIEDPGVWTQGSSSYDRVDRFNALLSASLAGGRTVVQIRRQGQLLQVALGGQAGCGGSVKFVDSSSMNAWSDGRHVVLNAGIVRMADSDDEVAFVIAHEMAHNILGHVTYSANTSRMLFGRIFGSAAPRDSESQADAAGVSLMRDAGYAPEGALRFLEAARRRMWWMAFGSLDHPGFGSRLRTVAFAIASQPVRFAPPIPVQAATRVAAAALPVVAANVVGGIVAGAPIGVPIQSSMNAYRREGAVMPAPMRGSALWIRPRMICEA